LYTHFDDKNDFESHNFMNAKLAGGSSGGVREQCIRYGGGLEEVEKCWEDSVSNFVRFSQVQIDPT
jgi:hypothetical protein